MVGSSVRRIKEKTLMDKETKSGLIFLISIIVFIVPNISYVIYMSYTCWGVPFLDRIEAHWWHPPVLLGWGILYQRFLNWHFGDAYQWQRR
jgi:hypothetical protein